MDKHYDMESRLWKWAAADVKAAFVSTMIRGGTWPTKNYLREIDRTIRRDVVAAKRECDIYGTFSALQYHNAIIAMGARRIAGGCKAIEEESMEAGIKIVQKYLADLS